LTELGNRLKEARLAKGFSLDDLQEVTKIQKRYLIGIEEGNYSLMPGSFYVRAFIKQYAEAVDLDPEPLFEEFQREIPNIQNDDIPGNLSRVQTKKMLTDSSSKLLEFLPKILIAVVVLGIFVFAWYFAQKFANDSVKAPAQNENKQEVTYEESDELAADKPDNEPANEEKQEDSDKPDEPIVEEPEKTEQTLSVVEANGSTSIYELKGTDVFQLKVVSTGETWVNIRNGEGSSFFQGMLKKGATESQSMDLSAETEVIVTAGRSTETEIYVNDQKLEYAVSPTEEVLQNITIRFIKNGTP
jgi:cytoskeletal protein RodZ